MGEGVKGKGASAWEVGGPAVPHQVPFDSTMHGFPGS